MRRFLPLLLFFLAACARQKAPVILISIDTLRADHLSAYGYRAIRTPAIDALAADGVVYTDCWSHCPLTLPSHLSVFTGLLPPAHGVRDNAGYRFDPAAHRTLASLLRSAGYRTGAAVSAYVLRRSTGAGDGFDEYDDAIGVVDGAPLGSLQRKGADTESIAERWIDAHAGEPFFYFLHLYEPHAPYEPTYDADVVAADAVVGRFLDHLRRIGIYDRATIVLLSDHGEGLMQHGEQEHGVFLYREDLHVPLIVKQPRGGRQGRVDSLAQLIDVAPTILDLAGLPIPATMQGLSLLRSLPSRTSYAESFFPRIHLGWSELHSMVRERLHAIDAPAGEVYDRHADPAEQHNLAAAERRAYSELRGQMRAMAGPFQGAQRLPPEETRKLAALGYVSAGVETTSGPLPNPRDVIGQLAQLKEVESLRSRGDHAAAIAILERLLVANPQWSDVREQLGDEYERSGDFAQAARVAQEGIRLTPRLAGSFALSAGYALLQQGRLDEAASHARLALEAGEPAGHLLLAEIALARQDWSGAHDQAAAAMSEPSQKAQALFVDARVAGARHDVRAVLSLLDEVQAARKANGGSLPRHFHYVAADALARSNRPAEAEQEFAREIASEPRNARAYADLALLQRLGGHPEAARITLDRLAALRPRGPICLEIARQLNTFGEKEAAQSWSRCARVDP